MINVLMSTYNSERYLQCQVDSILAQEGVSVQLTVRDDGSSDSTLRIMQDYCQRNANVRVYSDGENLKPARSFMRLLRDAEPTARFYAFADHDDYWQPDKLRTAVSMLEEAGNRPALYFSQTQLVDADLRPIPSVHISPRLTFGESLVYEFIGGCTMVMNRALRDIVCQYSPSYIPMHDVWIYSVALAVGAQVYFDPVPHILYRQHTGNAVGQGRGEMHEWHRRWSRLVNGERSRSRRAAEIRNGFGHLVTTDNRALVERFTVAKTSLRERILLLFDSRYKPANFKTWILFKLSVFLNIY